MVWYNTAMRKKNPQKTQFVGVRFDESTAKRLTSLANSLNMSNSRLVRSMLLYIDDRLEPVGRLTEFRQWLKRLEQITFGF